MSMTHGGTPDDDHPAIMLQQSETLPMERRHDSSEYPSPPPPSPHQDADDPMFWASMDKMITGKTLYHADKAQHLSDLGELNIHEDFFDTVSELSRFLEDVKREVCGCAGEEGWGRREAMWWRGGGGSGGEGRDGEGWGREGRRQVVDRGGAGVVKKGGSGGERRERT